MELAFKVEELAEEAEAIRSLTLAVYDAIYNGTYNYREFDQALHSVFSMAHDHMKHMSVLVEEMDEAYAALHGIKVDRAQV